MPNVQRLLDEGVTAAMRAAFPQAAGAPAIVQPSQDPRFGDYQANGAMALAKQLKSKTRLGEMKPRDVAAAVLERLDVSQICEPPEIAGPGFINLRLKPDWVAAQVGAINPDKPEDRLGVPRAEKPETVVVDYSAPNLAKEMHVGHLRSTIIGDALVRMLDFSGHKVVRQNHIGDWGTQFGTVILALWHICMAEKRGDPTFITRVRNQIVHDPSNTTTGREILTQLRDLHQADLNSDWRGNNCFHPYLQRVLRNRTLSLEQFLPAYQFVNLIESLAQGTGLTIKSPPDGKEIPFCSVSSYITSMLQDPENPDNKQEVSAWEYAKRLTLESCDAVYKRLNVLLTHDDIRGESFYHPWLKEIVDALREKGLLTESKGAQCVFLPGFVAKDGAPLPLLVQKSDEGYLYATTDLAAIRYRVGQLHADRILYVVDARQALHFQMLFACARLAGFAPPGVALEHVAFGTMMGADGKPFKTREGGTVKLMDLLNKAEELAGKLVAQKNADDVAAGKAASLSDDQKKDIAHKVGIGAVKYADLAQNRTSDYIFSWDKMLSLDGNTAPYMQYAYARVRSIFRKGEHEAEAHRADPSPIALDSPQELALGKTLLRFSEVLDRAIEDYRPNVLAAYLYDLAGAFTAFYDACPVIQSQGSLRAARLKLCDLTARIIARGLGLLGIDTAERM